MICCEQICKNTDLSDFLFFSIACFGERMINGMGLHMKRDERVKKASHGIVGLRNWDC